MGYRVFMVFRVGILSSFAQCEENAVLSTSKTNLTDVSGNHVGIKDEKTTLRFSKSAILLNIDGEDRGELKIVSQTCNWTTPYKEGKSVIKANMNDSDYTLTIEGKEGKINLHVGLKNFLMDTTNRYPDEPAESKGTSLSEVTKVL